MRTWSNAASLTLAACLAVTLGAGCGDKDGGDDTHDHDDTAEESDTDTDTDTDADTDTDTDTDTDADVDTYAGDFVINAEETNSGSTDTCTGSATVSINSDGEVSGEASCDFAGPFSKFGTTEGDIVGFVDPDGTTVTADLDTSPGPLYVEMTGTADGKTMELTFEGSLQDGAMNIEYDGGISATRQ